MLSKRSACSLSDLSELYSLSIYSLLLIIVQPWSTEHPKRVIKCHLNETRSHANLVYDGNKVKVKLYVSRIESLLEKWFPLQGERAHSLKLFCMYDKRFEISKTK